MSVYDVRHIVLSGAVGINPLKPNIQLCYIVKCYTTVLYCIVLCVLCAMGLVA